MALCVKKKYHKETQSKYRESQRKDIILILALGELVNRKHPQGQFQINLELGSLAPGIYLILIRGLLNLSKKILVVR